MNYIKRLESLVGAPIDIISTGPDRAETIVLRNPTPDVHIDESSFTVCLPAVSRGISDWTFVTGAAAWQPAAAGLYTFFALMVLYYPSTEFGVEAIAKPLEARYPAFSPEELLMVTPLLYWVVVLKPRGLWALGDLNHASDRVISAAELWHAKRPLRSLSVAVAHRADL